MRGDLYRVNSLDWKICVVASIFYNNPTSSQVKLDNSASTTHRITIPISLDMVYLRIARSAILENLVSVPFNFSDQSQISELRTGHI